MTGLSLVFEVSVIGDFVVFLWARVCALCVLYYSGIMVEKLLLSSIIITFIIMDIDHTIAFFSVN